MIGFTIGVDAGNQINGSIIVSRMDEWFQIYYLIGNIWDQSLIRD